MAKKGNKPNKPNNKKPAAVKTATDKNSSVKKSSTKTSNNRSSSRNAKTAASDAADKKRSLFVLAPVIALMVFIPLIAYQHEYSTGLDQYSWYTSVTETTDFFLYHKMVWIIIACAYMVICMGTLWFMADERLTWIKQIIPMAVYVIISIISAFTSINSDYSFSGIYEQFESVWVLVGYGVMFYYTLHLAKSVSNTKRLINWFVVGVTIMVLLGLTQVFKHDFFRTPTGNWYMTHNSDAGLQFNFELGRPYLTLYNPNYVGFYGALVLPVLVVLIFTTKKLWQKIFYAFLSISMFAIVFASQSRAGIVCMGISLFIIVIFARKMLFAKKAVTIASIIAIVAVVASFFIINKASDGVLLSRLEGMFSFSEEVHTLEGIDTTDEDVTIHYAGNDLHMTEIEVEGNPDKGVEGGYAIVFKDDEGKELPIDSLGDIDGNGVQDYHINDERFPIDFHYNNGMGYVTVVINGLDYNFSNHAGEYNEKIAKEDRSYYYYAGGDVLFKLKSDYEKVPFFSDHYSFANKRGFIWARTIPLLKKYFLLGSGPDTFIIAFPNEDVVGMNNSEHINEIITKPHCMYLQVGTQTGVISLIALLTLFIWYLVDCVRIYWKQKYDNYMAIIGVGIMASVIGYLLVSLTNDSSITIAPIFYCLLGIGTGVNIYLKKQIKENKEKELAEKKKEETLEESEEK